MARRRLPDFAFAPPVFGYLLRNRHVIPATGREAEATRLHGRHYLKWVVAVDVDRQLVVSQVARRGPSNDLATLRPLVDAAHPVTPIRWVLAGGEFDSELNRAHSREVIGADSVIPAKRGKPLWPREVGVRAQMRAEFPQTLYTQRALVETVFSVVKRKLSARAPGRFLENPTSPVPPPGPRLQRVTPQTMGAV